MWGLPHGAIDVSPALAVLSWDKEQGILLENSRSPILWLRGSPYGRIGD